jgi:predicted nucleotidyltransferase
MNGVKVRFINRNEILAHLVALAQQLLKSRADVIEVSLFGSLARGNYAPASDADIYIILREDKRKVTDRIPEFLDHFSKVGLTVEVFPYTLKEIERMGDGGFIKTVEREKVILSSR